MFSLASETLFQTKKMGLLVAALPKVILGRNKYILETLVPFLWLSDHGNSGTQETRISVGIFGWKKLRLKP